MKTILILLLLASAAVAQTTIVNLDDVRTGATSETFVDAVRNNRQAPATLQALLKSYAQSALANIIAARDAAIAARDAAISARDAAVARANELEASFNAAKALLEAGAIKEEIVAELQKDQKARRLDELKKARDAAAAAYAQALANP